MAEENIKRVLFMNDVETFEFLLNNEGNIKTNK